MRHMSGRGVLVRAPYSDYAAMELAQLKGVGSTTEQRLNEAGLADISDLAQADIDDLTDSGLSDSKAEKLVRRAKREAIVLQSGDDVVQEVEEKEHITTGMEAMDEMLGGGWREGHIAGVSGEASSGKTQLIFQSLVEAVEATGDPAVYIETERERYDPDRIAAIADKDDTQSKIYRIKAYSVEQQRESYEKVAEAFDSVSLVAVDSFTARLRLELYEDRSDLGHRNTEIAKHLRRIEDMVDKVGCPVLLTLQIYGNPNAYGGSDSTWGGALMDHTITYNIRMASAQGSFRKAQLGGHPGLEDDEVLITIGPDGLEAHKEG